MPSSSVPYIVIPLALLDGAEPPCAQAPHSKAMAKKARKRFMTENRLRKDTYFNAAPLRACSSRRRMPCIRFILAPQSTLHLRLKRGIPSIR
jgi:hypothetical protein